MNIVNHTPDPERLERFQSLQSGQYWRARLDIQEQGIDQGVVLLIQSIRCVEDKPHTVILRPHPSKIGSEVRLSVKLDDGSTVQQYFVYREHRFLLDEFLAAFEFEPNHQTIRSEEVRAVHARVNALQTELLEAQSNPALLAAVVNEALEAQAAAQIAEGASPTGSQIALSGVQSDPALAGMATGSVANAIGGGITEQTIASLKAAAGREHQVATIKSQWIQSKTTEIAETIKAMTPFYEEQAAAALAQTEDVRSYVAKLMEGIESLDLYIGKDVHVTTIREGASAPIDEPLTFVQKKLLMDEELAVWADIDEWFDFSKQELFFEALCNHDDLIEQIFPSKRCVLVMATTRRFIDYGDNWSNRARNKENEKVFLLVRNGQNIHRILSPVESHLGSERLFPSRSEHDDIFSGVDGSKIKFEDVAYTDRLASHDRSALHYKRLLLLVCGLDHRLKLFGDFYDGAPSLDFVSLDFQSRHCRFVHDDDSSMTLPGEKRTPLREWIQQKNAYLCSGSRVLCNWSELMNPDTAPSACDRSGDRFDRRYRPQLPMDIVTAYRAGQSIRADVQVSGKTVKNESHTFNCKVNFSAFRNGAWHYSDLPYLCLDAVDVDDIHWYIHNRDVRRDHLSYIRFFKCALKFLQAERLSEQDTRQRLADALQDGSIASLEQAKKIVDQAVVAWRAANRGKPLPCFEQGCPPPAWKSLLDQMYMLAGAGEGRAQDVAEFVAELGYEPLRLVLSGKGKLVVYAVPAPDEQDNRIEPHAWVHRIAVERGKSRLTEKSRRWTILPKSVASETTLHEWPQAPEWLERASSFDSFEHKQRVFDATLGAARRLSAFDAPMSEEAFLSEARAWSSTRKALNATSSIVDNPCFAMPFGVIKRSGMLRLLCVGMRSPHAVLSRRAPNDEARAMIEREYVRLYENKEYASSSLRSGAKSNHPWSLFEVSLAFVDEKQGYTGMRAYSPFSHGECPDPLISVQFDFCKTLSEKRKEQVWIAPDVFDSEGSLVLDAVLDNHRPVGFEPLQVVEVKIGPDSEFPRAHWFDICALGTDTAALITDVAGARAIGYRSSGHGVFITRAQARKFIEQQLFDAEMTTVSAKPEDFEPPEGVERWRVR